MRILNLALIFTVAAACCAVAGWYEHARTLAVGAMILATWLAVYKGLLGAGEEIEGVNEWERR